MVRILLAEGNGSVGAALRDVIVSIADLDLAWRATSMPSKSVSTSSKQTEGTLLEKGRVRVSTQERVIDDG